MDKKRNVLHDLYHGHFIPWERKVVRTEESKAIDKKIEDEKRYFMQKMSLDDCQRFEALDALYLQSSSFQQADSFSYSFKLATSLMCAVLTE